MMRFLPVAVGLCAVMLAAPEPASAYQKPSGVWMRTDGRTTKNNPKLLAQGQRDLEACKYEVEKVAAGLPPVYWQGIFGAISAGIVMDQKHQQLANLGVSCMRQKGWMIVTPEQAEAMAAQERKPVKRR